MNRDNFLLKEISKSDFHEPEVQQEKSSEILGLENADSFTIRPKAPSNGEESSSSSAIEEITEKKLALSRIFDESITSESRIQLADLVKSGVPMAMRKFVWPLFLDKHEQLYNEMNRAGNEKCAFESSKTRYTKSVFPNFWKKKKPLPDYQYQLKHIPLHSNAQWIIQIKKDLPRTFPDHPALDGRGRSALGRVLAAYVGYNDEDGYCQGMNFIAGVLILFLPEEIAFRSLTQLLQCILRGYHAQDLKTLLVDQRVFDHLLKEKFPDVEEHLTRLEVKSSAVISHWFLTAFVNTLQMEALLRVWDLLLFEGSISVLMRVALAMVKARRDKVLSTDDSADVFAALQQMPTNTSRVEIDALLIDVSCNYPDVNDEKIYDLRMANLKFVEEEFKNHASKKRTDFGNFFTKFTQSFVRASSVSTTSNDSDHDSLEEKADELSEMQDIDQYNEGRNSETIHRSMSACTTSDVQHAEQREKSIPEIIAEHEYTKLKLEETECALQQEILAKKKLEEDLKESLEVIRGLQGHIRILEAKLSNINTI